MKQYILALSFLILLGCSKQDPPAVNTTVDIKTGLVAFYPFNGNANDESGNSFNAVRYGPRLSDDRFGKANSAFYFDNNTYMLLPSNFGFISETGGISISLWFKSSFTVNPQQYFIDMRFGNGLRIVLDKYNTLDFNIESPYGGGAVLGPNTTDYTDKWVNMIGVLNQDSMYLYLNSELVAKNKLSKFLPIPITASSGDCNFCGKETYRAIGATNNLYYNQFTIGSLDDIRIYNRALTQEQITYLFKN